MQTTVGRSHTGAGSYLGPEVGAPLGAGVEQHVHIQDRHSLPDLQQRMHNTPFCPGRSVQEMDKILPSLCGIMTT